MRFSEKIILLKEAYQDVKINVDVVRDTPNREAFVFKKLEFLRMGLIDLEKAGFKNQDTQTLKNSVLFNSSLGELTLYDKEANNLHSAIVNLNSALSTTIKGINMLWTVEEEDPNTVFVKFPDTTSLEDVSKEAHNFNLILSQAIVNPEINGQVVIKSIEPGSIWLSIYIGSAIAVAVIGRLVWAAALAHREYIQGQMNIEQAKAWKIKVESLEDMKEGLSSSIKMLIEAEAQDLYDTHYGGKADNSEQVERLKLSIKMLSEELTKGAEIKPSLIAPEDVRQSFPKMKSLPTLESKIKKLEN